MSTLTSAQLRGMVDEIIADPTTIEKLDHNEVVELRKHLNPLGTIITADKSYASIGLTNWRDRYLRKLHMTAMVGYLFRMLEEYEFEHELDEERRRYEAAVKRAGDPAALDALKKNHEERNALIKSTVKAVIKRFLCRHFEYNPDHHLRTAHLTDKGDTERDDALRKIKEVCDNSGVDSAMSVIEAKLNGKPDVTYLYVRQMLLTATQTMSELARMIESSLPHVSEDSQGILMKKWALISKCAGDLKKVAGPILAAETRAACTARPPIDIFHQFNRYLDNHFEQLRDVVEALYCEKPDIEFSIQYHKSHSTPEAAREYKIQHEAEFRTEVITVENNGVTLLGAFKENRERADFYNKNTEILKLMVSQLEADHKLGKDLMEKQIKKQKKKNIAEAGPDAPGLATYSKHANVVQELGARKVLNKEEMDKLAESAAECKRMEEDYELDADAIRVDVLIPEESTDGITGLRREWFQSQAEPALHLQEGSPYVDQYQPKREPGQSMADAYETTMVTDKDGRKREIKVAVNDKNNANNAKKSRSRRGKGKEEKLD